MDWLLWTLGLFGSVLALRCIQRYLRWRKMVNILDRLPGPKAVPIFGNAFKFLIQRKDCIPMSRSLIDEFGPIFRCRSFIFNIVTITKPEHVEALLNSTQLIEKGRFYKFLEPWLGTGLLTSTGFKWFSHRRLLTPSFHFSILESFIVTFNEKSKILENKLRRINPGTEFDIYPYITLCTLDIICEAVMGVNMNTQVEGQKKSKKSDYISGVYRLTEATIIRMFRPWLYPDWAFNYLSSEGRSYNKSLKCLHEFTNKVVTDKRDYRTQRPEVQEATSIEDDIGIKKKRAFLDMLLEASDKEQRLTDEEVREEVDTFMFEGHDTTTAAICWTVFLLGHHPEIQEKVVEELHSIFQGKQRNMTSADFKEMKYLEMVIKETLRLYPSVPFFDRTLKNDLKLGEYLIPAGVDIRIAAYNMHRCAEYFENPDTFNPDNFLPEKIRNRHPFVYIPFSAGPRNCIGQKFAMMELKAMLAHIFLNFKIVSVEKVEDVVAVPDLILRPLSGLKVKLYPRPRRV